MNAILSYFASVEYNGLCRLVYEKEGEQHKPFFFEGTKHILFFGMQGLAKYSIPMRLLQTHKPILIISAKEYPDAISDILGKYNLEVKKKLECQVLDMEKMDDTPQHKKIHAYCATSKFSDCLFSDLAIKKKPGISFLGDCCYEHTDYVCEDDQVVAVAHNVKYEQYILLLRHFMMFNQEAIIETKSFLSHIITEAQKRGTASLWINQTNIPINMLRSFGFKRIFFIELKEITGD
ncbi:hypothetical protein AwErysi_05790 [Erysipelotrichaceae bacterium]|nr:hypothetical protein AwErysi_05790 [Erysipelotrichaceae bacterium]